MMQITLNDQIVEIKAGETIFSIIEKFSFSEEKIAIELDGEIIPKSEFSVNFFSEEIFFAICFSFKIFSLDTNVLHLILVYIFYF